MDKIVGEAECTQKIEFSFPADGIPIVPKEMVALLGKWLWRFFVKHESLWRKIICGKLGELEGGWTTRVWRDSFGMSLWKDITKGWEEFSARASIYMGNGSRTSFWWDIWAGDSKVKDVYPTILG